MSICRFIAKLTKYSWTGTKHELDMITALVINLYVDGFAWQMYCFRFAVCGAISAYFWSQITR